MMNAEANRSKARRWYAKNREKKLAYMRGYRDSNLEELRDKCREYQRSNKERLSEYKKSWSRKRRPHLTHYENIRRALRKSGTPPWADMSAIEKLYEESARMTRDTGIDHEVDHIYPLKHEGFCGLHVHWNLQVITATENRRKGNRIDYERIR